MALKSRECLMEDIKCLEIKLSNLQERFDVIVTWIRSEYCDLTGLPDYVLIAVRDDPSISDKKNEFGKIELVKVECDHFDDSIEDSIHPNSNDDALAVKMNEDIESVRRLNVQFQQRKLASRDMSRDEKRIRLKRDNSQPDKTVESAPLFAFSLLSDGDLKNENDQLVDDNSSDFDKMEEHNNFNLSLGKNKRVRVTKTAEAIKSNKEKGLILDADEYIQKVTSLPKDRLNCLACNKGFPTPHRLRRHELEVHLTKEEQIKFRSMENASDNKMEETNSDLDASSLGKNKRVRVTKTAEAIRANKEKGLILDADEYIEKVASLPKDRLNCLACNKGFPTPHRLRRHELEVHLTKEEQIKFRNMENTADKPVTHMEVTMCDYNPSDCNKMEQNNRDLDGTPVGEKKRVRVTKTAEAIRVNKEKGLILDADEYIEKVASLPKDRLNCLACGKGFPTPRRLRRHELEVHLTKEEQNKIRIIYGVDEKPERQVVEPTICGVCNLPFKKIESHQMCHLPPEVMTTVEGSWRPHYRCLKCNSLFAEKKRYWNHVKRDCEAEEHETPKLIEEKNFLCSHCGQAFNRKYTLKIHIEAVHAKRKDFKCKFCQKAFTVEYVKNKHEKKHLGMLRVTCDLCGFTFACKRGLLKHIKGVHENRRPYHCTVPFCDKSFKTAHARAYHINTHGDPNSRIRGLNRNVDPMHAAAKRRNCMTWINNRLQQTMEGSL